MSTVFTTCRNQNQSTTFNYYFMNDFQYLFYLCYFYLEFESLKRKALIVFNNGNIFEETQLYQDVITLFDKVETETNTLKNKTDKIFFIILAYQI